MSGYQALYRAWRPDSFAEVCGQEPIIRTLKRQIVTGHTGHAYLFCGSRGTGKTSTAKLLARALCCAEPVDGEPCGKCEACLALKSESSLDVLEIDAASNNSVDEIRMLRDRIAYPPTVGKKKVYIIDEVHMLSAGAFNALLKTLEEPPAHAVFILATTDPQKMPATVLSRCQRFDFKRITVSTIISRMKTVLDGIGRSCTEEALEEIAVSADGGMRDALSLLDMCLSYTEGTVEAELVREVLGTSGRAFMFDYAEKIKAYDSAAALAMVDEAMRDGRDARSFAQEAASHMRLLLMAQLMGEQLAEVEQITTDAQSRFIAQSRDFETGRLMRVMELFMGLDGQLRYAAMPRTVLELCTVKACRVSSEKTVEGLTERIETLETKIKNGSFTVSAAPAAKPAAPAKADASPKPAAPAAPAEPQVDSEDKQKFDAAMAKVCENNPSIKAFISTMKFTKADESTAYVRFPAARRIQMMALDKEDKKELFRAALTESFGRPMTISMSVEEGKSTPASGVSGRDLSMAFDIFGRDKVQVTE